MYKIIITLVMSFFCISAVASELTHDFKNPSFSGKGYSTHVLSIEQLQFQRKKEVQEKAEAEKRRLEREAKQETIAKFINNVESRIYANISKNLVDGMFEENGANSGTATIEGATINWVKDTTADTITITIIEADGTVTELTTPLTGFGF
tara:strand:- start:2639 stop:3088 length:450 start_codon:yes stop_codon:yes gene_type:complete